jgi:hypothetical protein
VVFSWILGKQAGYASLTPDNVTQTPITMVKLAGERCIVFQERAMGAGSLWAALK